MSASTKLKWRRHLNDLRHANEELEFVREIIAVSAEEFQEHYEQYCAKNNIDLKKLNRDNSDRIQEAYAHEEGEMHQIASDDDKQSAPSAEAGPVDIEEKYEMTEEEQEIHNTFSKIFKKLAMILHPDKMPAVLSATEREERLEMFRDAKIALEEKAYYTLLKLALKFEIALPRNHQQQIKWMKKELETLQATIEKEKATYNYRFSECETEDEKDSVVIKFMTQLFGPQIFSN